MAVTTSVVHPLGFGIGMGGFGFDVGFEFAFDREFSTRFGLRYLAFPDPDTGDRFSLFRLSWDGRLYPQGNYLRGWFISIGTQFQSTSETSPAGEAMRANTVSFFAGGGYKAIFGAGQTGPAFVLEPTLDVGWRISPYLFGADALSSTDGWIRGTNGPRFRLPVGMAF